MNLLGWLFLGLVVGGSLVLWWLRDRYKGSWLTWRRNAIVESVAQAAVLLLMAALAPGQRGPFLALAGLAPTLTLAWKWVEWKVRRKSLQEQGWS